MERDKSRPSISDKLRSAFTSLGLSRSLEDRLRRERDAKRALAPSIDFDDQFLDGATAADVALLEAYYSSEPNANKNRTEISAKDDEIVVKLHL